MIRKAVIFAVFSAVCSFGAESQNPGAAQPVGAMQSVSINGIAFEVSDQYQFFTWETLPADVKAERSELKAFTNPDGETHYYQSVYVPSGNLNWYQAAKLAEDAGGYLACISSEAENDVIFNMVNDVKFFWTFPKAMGPNRMNHYEIMIGPWLGGYQPVGSVEPAGGWSWLSGETWDYQNWAVNLDDGVIDKDPRPSDQPNNSGDDPMGQRVMGFGEMNLPVPTWGDYMDGVGTYGVRRTPGKSYGFVIEYAEKPAG